MAFDTILTNGLIVTASDILPSGTEIGITAGVITALGLALPHGPSTKILDARGAYITPGGIDSHVHLAQKNSPTGDGWESGTRSAAAGGTTTVIAFASQERGDESLVPVVEEYLKLADGQSYVDYGVHCIVTNPTAKILDSEFAWLFEQGVTSVKLYMTYEHMRVPDRGVLEILFKCRELGMTTMIHAESHDMISFIIEGLERKGNTEPYFHALARPRIAEDEASYRAISLAELADAPILIVHMSSEVAVNHVREAQGRLLPVHAETCPHYLFLLSEEIKGKEHDHFSGAKHVCSPPLRHRMEDLEGLWRGVANGTFTTWSSDHAPSKYDHPGGKKLGLVDGIPRFSKIPNGLPGVETRMALLFGQTEACLPASEAKLSLSRFVQLTASNAAKLYGLSGRKGSIAPGFDADLVVWYPGVEGKRVIEQGKMHHDMDYTPFEGVEVGNWPRWTMLRGEIVWSDDEGGVVGKKGIGEFLKRGRGEVVMGRTGNVPRGMLGDEREYWR